MPNHAPLGELGVKPLKIVVCHPNRQQAHPSVATRHFSHKRLKSVQGFDFGASPRKKYNQDRRGQQKGHKSVIFHIFGVQVSRKAIALKFGTGVDTRKLREQSLIFKI